MAGNRALRRHEETNPAIVAKTVKKEREIESERTRKIGSIGVKYVSFNINFIRGNCYWGWYNYMGDCAN